MFSKIMTFDICGARAFQVFVETDISNGIPYYDLVGMGNGAIKEAKKRIKAAILNQCLNFPMGHITQNLVPADVKKQGSGFDLPLALGILACDIPYNPKTVETTGVIGELSLDGSVLKTKGILASIVEGKRLGIKRFIIPFENMEEALACPDVFTLPVKKLSEASKLLSLSETQLDSNIRLNEKFEPSWTSTEHLEYDFQNVFGQMAVKRALEIAAAGKHNILLMGSPGSGKTFMARCLPGILPDLSTDEYFDVLKIYSSAGLQQEVLQRRNKPFRVIQPGITGAALFGGGRPIEIGQLSLAHNGVAFFDEFSELPRNIIERLRKPMEDKKIYITNCGTNELLPADFLFVGAANPCPCGNFYETPGKCTCSRAQVRAHMSKLSGAILDRIDIKVPVKTVPTEAIGNKNGEKSADIKARVLKALEIQKERFKNETINCNGEVENIFAYSCFEIDWDTKLMLDALAEKFGLSVRSYNKVIKVARTIADLEGSENISCEHIAESLQYRVSTESEVA